MLNCRGFLRQGRGTFVVLVAVGAAAGCGNSGDGRPEGDRGASAEGTAAGVSDPGGGSTSPMVPSANAAQFVESLQKRYAAPADFHRKVRPAFLPPNGVPQYLIPEPVAESMIRQGAHLVPKFPTNIAQPALNVRLSF